MTVRPVNAPNGTRISMLGASSGAATKASLDWSSLLITSVIPRFEGLQSAPADLLRCAYDESACCMEAASASGLLHRRRVHPAEPELGEERLAALEIRHGEVDEQHAAGVCVIGQRGSPVVAR